MTEVRGDAAALLADLSGRVAAEGRIAASLVELEQHPGHTLLTTTALFGRTAARWATAHRQLTQLWQDFGVHQGVVAAAVVVRDRRARPGDQEVAELRGLLREPTVEVARIVVERGITGTVERVEAITLDALTARMDVAYREVRDLVEQCNELHQRFLARLAPLADQVGAARRLAGDLSTDPDDPTAAAIAALTTRIGDLDRACTADPLVLETSGPLQQLTALEADVSAVSVGLASVGAVRDGWDDRLRELAAAVARVEALRDDERQTRQRAVDLIADTGLPAPPDRVPALRHQLAALPGIHRWARRAEALAALHADVRSATGELTAAIDLAGGLVDRRAELRGRIDAYHARAVRLGFVEDGALRVLDERIRRLLWTRPCDLGAATRALAAYQGRIRELDVAKGRPA